MLGFASLRIRFNKNRWWNILFWYYLPCVNVLQGKSMAIYFFEFTFTNIDVLVKTQSSNALEGLW